MTERCILIPSNFAQERRNALTALQGRIFRDVDEIPIAFVLTDPGLTDHQMLSASPGGHECEGVLGE
jgi:hypothetical protein